MNASDLAVVTAWHDALNAGDVDRLVALSSEDVEVGGPRGSGKGAALLREWFGRAGVRLELRRVFERDGTVVAAERAVWRSPETGQDTDSREVATVFRVRDGRVAAAIRYDDLDAALRTSGLALADERRLP